MKSNKIIIGVLLVLLILFLFKRRRRSTFGKFRNNGFSSVKARYTKPVVVKDIVTKQEADYIINEAKKTFKKSMIVGGYDDSIRKSETTWLYKSDPVVYNIINRICDMNGYSIDNTEALQVVRYKPGGYYNEHHDACCEKDSKCNEFVENGGQRVLTVLIYLNDDFTGGSTKFPTLNLDIKPPKYGAVIFRPLEEDSNRCHPYALHKGTPVTSGEKYVCNIWIREGPFKGG